MKRVLLLFIGVILLTSIVSADIIINEQPGDLYNLGEIIKIPIKVATTTEINDFLSIKLICNGIETEIHKQYIALLAGEEQDIMSAIPLMTSFIGRSTGKCVIKPVIGEDYVITNEFTISNYIALAVELEETEFIPTDNIIIEGSAIKDNGQNSEGYIDVTLLAEDLSIGLAMTETINNGVIYLNITIPENTKAGVYVVQFNAYEKDKSGSVTNTGYAEASIRINQVPKNLEIIFEKAEAVPGENHLVKAVLHDQTGEKIEITAMIKVRNEKGKLIQSTEINTDEYLEIPIEYNEPAAEWLIEIKSYGLENEATFEIIEKEEVKIEIANRTVVLTNVGNVPYNETIIIKIGNDTIEIDTFIAVDDLQKYTLTAPDGEYDVEVASGNDNTMTKRVMLTGNAISVEEASKIRGLFNSFIWIFMIAVLGFVAFTVYKKGYKKTFLGRIIPHRRPKDKTTDNDIVSAASLIDSKHPAELSLSIKGHRQNTSIVCLRVKNQGELSGEKEGTELIKEIFQQIADLAEKEKAAVYENKDNIFFLLSPARTKTFKNQKPAVKLAEKIKNMLDSYNRMAKQRINFGLGINYGTIIVKPEKNVLRFMSMGTLITTARKLANHSRSEVLLSEDVNNKLRADIRAEKHTDGNLTYFTVTEVKDRSAKNKKFIGNFIKKLEKDNKEAANKKAREPIKFPEARKEKKKPEKKE